ncbi:MAG: HAD-IA family hydrolase [Acidimicrobiales bacterium]
MPSEGPAPGGVPPDALDAPMAPEVIAFDALGTLFSLAALEPLFVAAGADPSTAQEWFSRLVGDGCALTAAKEYQPFRDVAKATLRDVLPGTKAAARDKVLAGLAKLEPFDDGAPAMGRVIMSARVVVISNASADSTRKLLARGRLDAFVDSVISAEDVKQWKPGSSPYAFAAATQDVPLERMALVSAHPWDVLGARKAGLVTGWCSRTGGAMPAPFGKPHVVGANLLEVVEKLLVLRGDG